MKEYLIGLWEKFKNTTLIKKLTIIFLMILYIGIVCICLIKVDVDLTTPGSITRVDNVISIETENERGNIFTVSVYSKEKVSILEYLFIKLDKNSEISMGVSLTNTIFTPTEEYNSNYYLKLQSIQDSIIVAYNAAIEKGHEVKLDYNYSGERIINYPQNLFKTGGDNIKNGDIITKINNNNILSATDYYKYLDDLFSTYLFENQSIKDIYNKITAELVEKIYNKLKQEEEKPLLFTVLRENKEIEIKPSYDVLFYLYTNLIIANNECYKIVSNHYSSYNINYNNCSPKINISKSNTVGPSGGLLQTLAVYNAITKDDITKGLSIMGTGSIDLNGIAHKIGGEQQKIVTANLYNADVFFIPKDNYPSALEKYNEIKNPSYDLVSVENFNDILIYLEKLEVSNGTIQNSK